MSGRELKACSASVHSKLLSFSETSVKAERPNHPSREMPGGGAGGGGGQQLGGGYGRGDNDKTYITP